MDLLVSVYCFAYNHASYIRDALEGFVHQETNFPYEVIVHDDASTDSTPKIIAEYASNYPNIIKPIFQSENQYSQGIDIFSRFIFPQIKGKYIAACEGDDYWCDSKKLQRQADWLEKHPDYSFCVHNTVLLNCIDGSEYLINPGKEDRDVSIEEIIQWKEDHFHTSSYMFRSEYAITPSAFFLKGTGDYSRAMYLATCGKVRYLSGVMSVYRYLSSHDSWSMKMYRSFDYAEKMIAHWQDRIMMLETVNKYTQGKFSVCIHDVIRRNEFNILCEKKELKKIKKYYRDYYHSLSRKNKVYLHIGCYCPIVLTLYHNIRSIQRKTQIGSPQGD